VKSKLNIRDGVYLGAIGISDACPAMRGRVIVRAYRRGKFLWQRERENLVVTAHGTPTSKLLGGTVTNQSIGAFGVGSGTVPVAITDTQLTAPAYYKAVGTPTYPAAGQVSFPWTLVGGTDTGAYGVNIQEIGLFCNTGAISLPVYESSAPPSMTLYAHVLLGLGVYGSSLTFSGAWIITC